MSVVLAAAGDTAVRSLHLIAGAVWAGGLVFLGVAVGAARRTLADEERIAFFRAVGRRFTVVGGIALLLAIATGADLASDRGVWGDLTGTTYGCTLLAKLIMVGLVVGLTVVHSAVQGPALSRLRERAVESPDDAELATEIRKRSRRAGLVSALNLLATLAILVLAARLLTL